MLRVYTQVGFIVILMIVWNTLPSKSTCPNNYSQFYIPKANFSNLCCPDVCKMKKYEEHCCRCLVKPNWLILDSSMLIQDLDIEYATSRGDSRVFSSENIGEYLRLEHIMGFLSAIPKNVCDFKDHLKLLDLKNNFIKDIDGVSCLEKLDTLKLDGNLISKILVNTFRGMNMLRELSIVNNTIIEIEPNSLADPSLSTLKMHFGFNKLSDVDVTNVLVDRPFCEIDFSDNPITKITNKEQWKLDESKIYLYSGFISIRNSNITYFMNFTELGIPDINMLGKFLYYGFDLTGANWTCDCRMALFLKLSEPILIKIFRDYFKLKCSYPPELTGQYISTMVRDQRFDEFICNISIFYGCPASCHCYQQTSRDKIVVNCTSKNITILPSTTPLGDNLEIYLQDNNIKALEDHHYMDRVNVLDVSKNEIIKISSSILKTLGKRNASINLIGNAFLKRLPQIIRSMDYCAVRLGNITVSCHCDSLWIGEWVKYKKPKQCQHQNNVGCMTVRGFYKAEDFTADTLDCYRDSRATTLAIALLVITAVTVISIETIRRFRYELFILQREFRKPDKNRIDPFKKYDAYISINDSVKPLNVWVRNTLVPFLEESRYKMCLPIRDFDLGTIRQEEIIENVHLSRHVIVVLSDEHLHPDEHIWSRIEWKHTWEAYCSGYIEKIVIINYDYVQFNDTVDGPLKAFLRLSKFLDFSNHKQTLISDVKKLIGRPLRQGIGDTNGRVKFNSSTIGAKYMFKDKIQM